MIRSLRRRHLIVSVGMLALLPAGLAAALLVRPQFPVLPSAPATEAAADHSGALWSQRVNDITLVVTRDAQGLWLELSGPTPEQPDALVYWVRPAVRGLELAPGARLLGEFTGTRPGAPPRRLRLPDEASSQSGQFQLLSLAHGKVFASVGYAPREN